jgi:hypothetical protein
VKRPHTTLKLAAVASSVVLVAGFVSYRAGAFDGAGRPDSSAVESEPNPTEAADQAPVEGAPSEAMMSGSKSIIFVVPPSSPSPGGSTAGRPPAIMSGSKSVAPLIPPAGPPPAQAANPPK